MYLTVLLAVLPLLLSQAHGLDTCPDGWMEAHGVDMGCLYFSHPKDHKSHDDAKAYCVEKHEEAYLVEVRSPQEETFLHLALQIMEEGSGVHETTWWNGATNGGVEDGPWYWEGTGETLIEDGMWGTWQPGEPQGGELCSDGEQERIHLACHALCYAGQLYLPAGWTTHSYRGAPGWGGELCSDGEQERIHPA